MSRSGVNTDGLSQHGLPMLCAARPAVCRRWLIFPAVFGFKALRWAFKRLLRWRWRPPSDFPSLSPPVHCPFQCLIYGPHKCAREAEISEEVINRTKPRKRAGKGNGLKKWQRHAEWKREKSFYALFQSAFSAAVSTVFAACLAVFFCSLPSCQLTFELLLEGMHPCGLFS